MSKTLGGYRIIGKLGEGGMGVVYAGEHQVIGRRAAIKLLRSDLSQSRYLVTRFINEARACAQIDHPGIVEIYDFATDTNGQLFIVMELLEGESLADYLRRNGPLAGHAQVAADIVCHAASAVAMAHSRGIVHRDLKPDNLFLSTADTLGQRTRVKVLDFGIAKLASAETEVPVTITQTGNIMGTPVYMSPEQCRGARDLDHRSDIYSLGCILFQALVGRPPFQSPHGGELIAAHLRSPPPDVRTLRPEVPPALAAITASMLAKSPDERPQSMDDVVASLWGAGSGGPSTAFEPGVPMRLPAGLELARKAIEVPGTGATPQPTPVAPSPAALPTVPSGPQTTFGRATGELGTPQSSATRRQTRRRWLAIVAGASLPIMLAIGIVQFAKSKSSQTASNVSPPLPPPPAVPARVESPPPRDVEIAIENVPADAEVTVDGTRVSLPIKLKQSSDTHLLRVSAPGYETKTIEVRAGSDRTLVLDLRPLAPEGAPATRASSDRRRRREASKQESKPRQEQDLFLEP